MKSLSPSETMAATPANSQPLTLRHYQHHNQGFHEDLGEGVRLTMMQIPAGTFTMGAPESEEESEDDERPQHEVEVPEFFMGRYAVTQEQWRVVAGYKQVDQELDPDPSNFKGANRPVEQVSWDETQEFCKRLSEKTGREYRLPSESEWEYACRAGTETPFHFGEMLDFTIANYNGNYTYGEGAKGEYREETTEVGTFPANRWGLHDMHGNVYEWCEDDWHSNYEGAPPDGSAWINDKSTTQEKEEEYKLLRGGSWILNPRFCRSAYRLPDRRDHRVNHFGFRVVCSPQG